MEIIIIIALILLNGIFSMSEMSLVSARKFKLESAKKKGSKGAKTALDLSENPTRFLSTVQIGITLIGILLGVYSGENMTKDVEQYLAHFEQLSPYAHNLAVVIIVIGVTYLSIVLGELLPKRLGLTFPEPIAIFLAKPMKMLSVITSPFVWLLTISNDILIKILGITSTMDSKVSEEEIKSIIKESAEGGEIQDIEQDIVERVFEFGDKKVNSLFTHKNDIVFFDETDDLQTVRQKITAEKHSAYPVCTDNDIDKVVGIVLLKDLFTPSIEDNFNLRDFIKEPLFLTESTFAYSLLEKFKTVRMHYAIVVDEYGSTKGIVTMDDVVDALIGDVTEHNQHEYQITVRDENSWFVDGQYSFTEFLHYFDIDLEEEMDGNFVTIAGFFIHKFNNLPNIGDKLNIDAYRLEIIDKDGQRIDKIMVTKRP
ncbi:MAG: HlyC/CorC family transporter [Paludibacter sp.]|nr:HlyC/CorC family transporter [Paludibacter sp.]